MNIIKKLNYLFDKNIKLKLVGILIIITVGALAELLGISSILPIIDMTMNLGEMTDNIGYKIVYAVTGETNPQMLLVLLILGVVVIYVAKSIYLTWMNVVLCDFSIMIKKKMAIRLMNSYMKQPYSYFLSKKTSEIIRSVNNDTSQLYEVILNCLNVVSNSITVFFMILLLIYTNWKIVALIGIVMCGVFLPILKKIQTETRRLGRDNQEYSAELIQYVKQAFEGIKEIKIMNKERYFIHEYDTVYGKQAEVTKKAKLFNVIPKYSIETITVGLILMYLGFNVYFNENYLSIVPQLSVFAVSTFKVLPCINSIYAYFNTIMFHKASIDLIYHDIKEVEGIQESIEGERIEFCDSVELKSVSFAYDNQKETNIIEEINLKLDKGRSIAFIGPSGGGKTTTVDIIIGLLKPTRGEVVIDGQQLVQKNMRGWQKNIGYIPQNIYLLDDTIRKNVAFGVEERDIDDERVWRALEQAQLKQYVETLPEGLSTYAGERGTRLSGGQRQRIGIARALYYDPNILVFDEATSALDNETEREVMQAIESLQGNKTLLMIAHRLSTIEGCDMVYKVENKKVERIR